MAGDVMHEVGFQKKNSGWVALGMGENPTHAPFHFQPHLPTHHGEALGLRATARFGVSQGGPAPECGSEGAQAKDQELASFLNRPGRKGVPPASPST